jgi:hypothetical protein
LETHVADETKTTTMLFLLEQLSGSKVMTIWSLGNDHLYFIMVAILNFICLYQEIAYQKLFRLYEYKVWQWCKNCYYSLRISFNEWKNGKNAIKNLYRL